MGTREEASSPRTAPGQVVKQLINSNLCARVVSIVMRRHLMFRAPRRISQAFRTPRALLDAHLKWFSVVEDPLPTFLNIGVLHRTPW